MKIRFIFTILMAIISFSTITAEDSKEIKKKINSIKKSSQYLYADATAATAKEAYDMAEQLLYEEISAWAATKKNLQNSSNLMVNNKQSIWSTLTVPRGNMFRAFIYVKKKDVLPVNNPEIIENTTATSNTASSDATALESTVTEVWPDAVNEVLKCTTFDDVEQKMKELKASGKVKQYDRYARLQNPENYYLVIYNTDYKVVAVLTPGNERRNVETGEADSVGNYSGHGAVGFEVGQ